MFLYIKNLRTKLRACTALLPSKIKCGLYLKIFITIFQTYYHLFALLSVCIHSV